VNQDIEYGLAWLLWLAWWFLYISWKCLGIFFIWCAYQMLRPYWLITKGKYDDAIVLLERLARYYPERWGTKNTARFNIALRHHRKGDFEQSENWLNQMDTGRLCPKSTGNYYGLLASNPIMQNRELDLADQYLDRSQSLIRLPNAALTRGHLELLRGNKSGAAQAIADYMNTKDKPKRLILALRPVIFVNLELLRCMSNYVLGFYYSQTGDATLAKKHLAIACSCKYRNLYSDKADSLLKALDSKLPNDT
jgi:tetratricopeptide (TPR) repeat protein